MSKYRYAWTARMREARDLLLAEHGDDHAEVCRIMARWVAGERKSRRPFTRVRRNTLRADRRRRVFERDGYRCRRCGDHHRLTIHHDRAISQGGTHDEANLITLCLTCHDLTEMRRDLIGVLRQRCGALVAVADVPRRPATPIHVRRGFVHRRYRATQGQGE